MMIASGEEMINSDHLLDMLRT